MRTMKMMLIASLMSAACGQVSDPNAKNGSGSDSMGSDMSSGGMDAGSPHCTTAADCGADMACDLATQACLAGMLTLDESSFVNDGARLWTDTDHPMLQGTYDGPMSAAIAVSIGSAQPIPAITLNHASWSIALPAGSLSASDTMIRVILTDPSGTDIELSRTMTFDNVAPRISLGTSAVRDEREDKIDFSSGEPVHTHSGASIVLGEAGCPAVYKYAYLMGNSDPLFGTETSENPLAWHVAFIDAKLDPTYSAYRVRTGSMGTVLNWVALALSNPTIQLTSDTLPQLATNTGNFYVDVRAKDWTGLETMVTYCFDNHPMAPPVEMKPFTKELLFSQSLSNTQLSQLYTYGSMAVVRQTVVAYSNERQTLTWTMPIPNVQYTKAAVDDIVGAVSTQSVACPQGLSDPSCTYQAAPSDHADVSANGLIAPPGFGFQVYVWDPAASQPVAFTARGTTTINWDVPGRAAGESPHMYNVIVYAMAPAEILPPRINSSPMYGEYSLDDGSGAKTFTGEQLVDTNVSSCVELGQTVAGPTCLRTLHYWRMSALDHITLAFDGFDSTLETQTSTIAKASVNYAGMTTGSGPLTWDSGDEDLPGPH